MSEQRSQTSEVEVLAREVGADFRPEHNTLAFRARWAAALAVLVRDLVVFRGAYPERVCEWADRIDNATDAEMVAILEAVREEIEAIDSDDGSATDPAGAALEMVCLSLMPDTRWMAHAAQGVWGHVTGAGVTFNEVVKFSRDAWLQDLYRRCTEAGRS